MEGFLLGKSLRSDDCNVISYDIIRLLNSLDDQLTFYTQGTLYMQVR